MKKHILLVSCIGLAVCDLTFSGIVMYQSSSLNSKTKQLERQYSEFQTYRNNAFELNAYYSQVSYIDVQQFVVDLPQAGLKDKHIIVLIVPPTPCGLCLSSMIDILKRTEYNITVVIDYSRLKEAKAALSENEKISIMPYRGDLFADNIISLHDNLLVAEVLNGEVIHFAAIQKNDVEISRFLLGSFLEYIR